jgi:hypothetical protein
MPKMYEIKGGYWWLGDMENDAFVDDFMIYYLCKFTILLS